MKLRAEGTVSERELADALAGTGRRLALCDLAGWRRDGLLPPLASYGLGTGKGKSYYWREPDILAHACAAFDLRQKYAKPDLVILRLWLLGYSVPLPQLRRAWNRRGKDHERRRFSIPLAAAADAELHDTPALLLHAALLMNDSLTDADHRDDLLVVKIIALALARLTRVNRHDHDAARAEQLWRLVQTLTKLLEASDLIADSSDEELRAAQSYLRIAARLVQACASDLSSDLLAGGAEPWSIWLAERMGSPLFLLILVELRSGRRARLDALRGSIETWDRRNPLPPVQSIYQTA